MWPGGAVSVNCRRLYGGIRHATDTEMGQKQQRDVAWVRWEPAAASRPRAQHVLLHGALKWRISAGPPLERGETWVERTPADAALRVL